MRNATRIIQLGLPYWRQLSGLLILTILNGVFSLYLPIIIARGIDAWYTGRFVPGVTIGTFLATAAAVLLLTWLQGFTQAWFSERVAEDLRIRLSEKISAQSYAWVASNDKDHLLTRLTADVDSIKIFIAQTLFQLAASIFMVTFIVVILALLNLRMALWVFLGMLLMGLRNVNVLKKIRALFRKGRILLDRLNKVIGENIGGAGLIRVLGAGGHEMEKFQEVNRRVKDLGYDSVRLLARFLPIMPFTSNLTYLAILVAGSRLVLDKSLTLGEFAAFTSYLAMLVAPVQQITSSGNIITAAITSYERVAGILTAPEAQETGSITDPLRGKIEIEGLSLAYRQVRVLYNVSLIVEPGSRAVILGPTSAGKTTLLYMLMGLIPLPCGAVRFDGKDIGQYREELLQRCIGIVFQDPVIFHLTIRENIVFHSTVTTAALEKAIETAELKDFIDSLPAKLETVISEKGSDLSGGQKQRIMLARAVVTEPKILLLDDFTARVDVNTERRILDNLASNYPDMTLLCATQQIARVQDYDHIVLLMQGEVVCAGSHEWLLQASSEYARLFYLHKSNYELRPERTS